MNFISHRYTDHVARLAVYIALFALPFSRPITNGALVIAVMHVLLHEDWRERWLFIWQYRFVKIALAFILLLVLGIGYSQGTLTHAIQGFSKYAKILFITFFLPLFTEVHYRNRAMISFVTGVFCCAMLNTMHVYGWIDVNSITNSAKELFSQASPIGTFTNPIPFSILEAFACYISLYKLFMDNRYKWFYLILFLFGSYHLFFINLERTGMLCYLCLLGLFAFQRIKWQIAVILMALIIPGLLVGLYYKSASFSQRITEAHSDITAYRAGKVDTSIGLRFSFWRNSWHLFKQAPILGHGTGSFETIYAKMDGVTATPGVPLADPHNEYVLIATQWGLLGLLIYLTWFAVMYYEARALTRVERQWVHALVLTMLVSSMTHVVMYTHATGTLFILGLSCFFAAKSVVRSK